MSILVTSVPSGGAPAGTNAVPGPASPSASGPTAAPAPASAPSSDNASGQSGTPQGAVAETAPSSSVAAADRTEAATPPAGSAAASAEQMLAAARQAAAARPGGLAPLMADLTQVADADLPPAAQKAVQQILDLRMPTTVAPSGADIAEAFARSGLFTEANFAALAQGETAAGASVPADLKSLILVLQQALRGTMEAMKPTTSASSAPLPASGSSSAAAAGGETVPSGVQTQGVAQNSTQAQVPAQTGASAGQVAVGQVAAGQVAAGQATASSSATGSGAILAAATDPAVYFPQVHGTLQAASSATSGGAAGGAGTPQPSATAGAASGEPATPASGPVSSGPPSSAPAGTAAEGTIPASSPSPGAPAASGGSAPAASPSPVQPSTPAQPASAPETSAPSSSPSAASAPASSASGVAPLPPGGYGVLLSAVYGAADTVAAATDDDAAVLARALQSGTYVPPPFHGGATAAQVAASALLPKDADIDSIVRYLFFDSEAALSHQKLLQFASLPDGGASGARGSGSPHWMFEIPLASGEGTAVAQFAIDRDGGGTEDGERREPIWRVRFSVDLEPLGPVHVGLALSGAKTWVTLWASRAESMQALRAGADDLAETLKTADLEAEIAFAPVAAPQAKPSSPGHFLDHTS